MTRRQNGDRRNRDRRRNAARPQTARWKLRLLAIALTGSLSIILLWGGELVLELGRTDPGIAAMQSAAAAGRPFDPRSRTKVVTDLRAKGVSAVPRLVPAAMLEEQEDGVQQSILEVDGAEFLPLAGISNETTVLCNETGRYAIYESDEHGFRNPAGSWTAQPVDLLLIGDSFTIGECVAPGETIADRLRADWPGTVNLGYSGHSPLLELATLVEYGRTLKPRITLWFYFENDDAWFDLGRSRNSPLLMRYLDTDFSQSLVNRQPVIDQRLRELVDDGLAQPDEAGPYQRSRDSRRSSSRQVLDFLKLVRTRSELARLQDAPTPSPSEPDDPLLEAILRRARDHVASWQGELFVVFLPGVWHFDSKSTAPSWARRGLRDVVARRAESLNLRFLDLKEVLENHSDPLSLYSFRGESRLGSPHMNAAGYALTAEAVRNLLQE